MLEAVALVCASCGGPLSAVERLPAVVDCGFCGAVMSIAHDAQTITKPATPSDELELRAQKRIAARPKFVEELTKQLAAGRHPYEAMRDAWNMHLLFEATGEPIARLSVALARDFERDNDVPAVDALALSRLAEAYVRAVNELRTAKSTDLNLPFFTNTTAGPKHLNRTVTAQVFAELARRDPYVASTIAAPPPAPEPPKKRKKLFGLF
jgi:hypothetical protein